MAAEDLGVVSFDLVTALTAKNFVILTGPSGTGKSRAALRLAESLQRLYADKVSGSIFELVPVGPDWTTPKRLLGYKTPFGTEREKEDGTKTHDSYEITDTVRLILRASHPDAVDIPHFLIFDEMNLSHVERYFAPFLSLMEAANILDEEGGVALIDIERLVIINDLLQGESPESREAEAAKMLLNEGRSFIVPPNLFFVGTVNVDETTYMFSPKVLDRAHVIELNSERPSIYLLGTGTPEPGGTLEVSQANELLHMAIEDRESQRNELPNPADIMNRLLEQGFTEAELQDVRQVVVSALDGCYDLLSQVGFPFGYRISKEVFVYLTTWVMAKMLTGIDKAGVLAIWPEGLDKALLQKVLPKLHGNRRSLGDSLKALSAFLIGNHAGSTPPASYTIGIGTTVSIPEERKLELPGAGLQLPLSRRKLDGMHNQLTAIGNVSFVS